MVEPIVTANTTGTRSGPQFRWQLVQRELQHAGFSDAIVPFFNRLGALDDAIKKTQLLLEAKARSFSYREGAEVSEHINTAELVLRSIAETVEACCKDLKTAESALARDRLSWLFRNYEGFPARGWTVSDCIQVLTSHISRMSVLQQDFPPPKYEVVQIRSSGLRPPSKRHLGISSDAGTRATSGHHADNSSRTGARSHPESSSEWNNSITTLTANGEHENADPIALNVDHHTLSVSEIRFQPLPPPPPLPPKSEILSGAATGKSHLNIKVEGENTAGKVAQQQNLEHQKWTPVIENVRYCELPGSEVPIPTSSLRYSSSSDPARDLEASPKNTRPISDHSSSYQPIPSLSSGIAPTPPTKSPVVSSSTSAPNAARDAWQWSPERSSAYIPELPATESIATRGKGHSPDVMQSATHSFPRNNSASLPDTARGMIGVKPKRKMKSLFLT